MLIKFISMIWPI